MPNKFSELFITWFVDVLSLEINNWHIYLGRDQGEKKAILRVLLK